MLRKPGRPRNAVCANCGETYINGDRYCRFCGAPMGSPKYIEEFSQCIYGPPPIERIHTCKECGFTWKSRRMIDREHWCPQCGGAVTTVSADDDDDDF